MKIKQILVAFLFATLVISCGNKSKNIPVKELKTECDVLDAFIIVFDEIIVLGEAVDSEEGVIGALVYRFEGSKEQKKEFESLSEIADEIEERRRELDIDEEDFEDCSNYETFNKKYKKTKQIAKLFD